MTDMQLFCLRYSVKKHIQCVANSYRYPLKQSILVKTCLNEKNIIIHFTVTIKKQLTFLTVAILKGFPAGNCIILGNNFDKRLKVKQIIAETKHWNHAINMGASTSSLSVLNKVLLTNTVKIEITL